MELAESPEHRKLVGLLIAHIRKEGFQVTCASYEGFTRCGETSGHIPDARGSNADELNAIGEAKTGDDIGTDRSREQYKVFSSRRMTNGKSRGKDVPFYIAVPSGCEKELDRVLSELGLANKPNIHRVSFDV